MSMRHTTTLDNPDMVRYRRSRSGAAARHCLIPRGNRFALSTAPKGGIHPEHGAYTTRCKLKRTTYHSPL